MIVSSSIVARKPRNPVAKNRVLRCNIARTSSCKEGQALELSRVGGVAGRWAAGVGRQGSAAHLEEQLQQAREGQRPQRECSQQGAHCPEPAAAKLGQI